MKKPIIAFTGGHHNSALVIALAARKQGYQIIWFGHKFAAHGDKSLSAEYQEVTQHKIPFIELKTGKLYRQLNPLEYLKVALGFFQAFVNLVKYRPHLIVSFGGFLAVPVVIVGWFLGIPAITHEQTVTAGWANKAISPFVKKILLSHQVSQKNYPAKKTLVTGLPLRPELLTKIKKQVFKPKLLYITCGKQGSHIINQAVFPLIPDLVKKYTIVHQTGANTKAKDASRARRLKKSLAQYQNRYLHAPYFFSKQAAIYLKSAHLVISRAGAHQTYELSLLNQTVIFIPIPWVSHNEQLLNAQLAKKYTNSIILPQKDLTPESLMAAINKLSQQKTKPLPQDIIKDATDKILAIINELA